MRENGGRGAEPRPSADERRPPHALAEPLLDTSAAARLLSVRPSWIYEAVRAGRIPHLKIGRHIRFLRSDLEDWVVSRRVRESAASRIRRR
jgi:excisionase family DNA binding protein